MKISLITKPTASLNMNDQKNKKIPMSLKVIHIISRSTQLIKFSYFFWLITFNKIHNSQSGKVICHTTTFVDNINNNNNIGIITFQWLKSKQKNSNGANLMTFRMFENFNQKKKCNNTRIHFRHFSPIQFFKSRIFILITVLISKSVQQMATHQQEN